MVAVALVADFASQDFVASVLPYVIAILLIYLVVVEIQSLRQFRRGEIRFGRAGF